MARTIELSKQDVARAFVQYQLRPSATVFEALAQSRSVQFDPLSPIGCNHDLVLHARIEDYKIGDWQKAAYKDRTIYDGWDKQASLIPFAGWPMRRVFYDYFLEKSTRVLVDHKYAIEAVLEELRDRGPLLPREFVFQERKAEWKDHWHGPNLTKQALKALWHAGKVMTAGRRGNHHVYDLTERVVPPELYNTPKLSQDDAVAEIIFQRHEAMGIIRPAASYEMWGFPLIAYQKTKGIAKLVAEDRLQQVSVEGIKAHATQEFLATLDVAAGEPQVKFIAPLDQIMWDRKLIAQVFGFDYIWEVYKPEKDRKFGYYVLPVLYGDRFVARAEFWCREGLLELRCWHWELGEPSDPRFWPQLELALASLMRYASARKVAALSGVDRRVLIVAKAAAKSLR